MTSYGPVQLARRLGLARWQFDAAAAAGLIPPPDAEARWSAAAAEQLAGRTGHIDAAVGSTPRRPGRRSFPGCSRSPPGRQILAYNADYDCSVVVGDSQRHGLSPGHLDDAERWGCLMATRSTWNRRPRPQRLGGGHRALDDSLAALDVLRGLAEPQRTRAAV